MKDILIIADFCGPLDGTFNSRFLYLAEMISKENKVEILTSDFNHGSKSYFQYEVEKHEFAITMLHEAAYPRNVCLRRFYGHYIWGKNVKKYLKTRKKPDVVFCAVPTLKAAYEAARYCEKNGIRFVIDIQDLWPEAFRMSLNIPIVSSIIFSPFAFLANEVYKRADSICAVSDTYCQRAQKVNKKCKQCTSVYLGTDLALFDTFSGKLPKIKKNRNEVWLAYCGTLGASYDLTVVFDALHMLNYENYTFVVMGDGPRKKEFEEYSNKFGIKTVFTGRIEYREMCSLLSECDIAVNPITHMAAQSIINKHADYAASGLPVLSTQENKEYKELIDSYQMGFNCNNQDPIDFADKLKILIENRDLRLEMGKNARRCAEERFDRGNTYQYLKAQIID